MPSAYARLPPMERAFVEEFLIDQNAERAALAVGFTPHEAKRMPSWLKSRATVPKGFGQGGHAPSILNPTVKLAVHEALLAQARRAQIAGDQIIDELKKIAFSNLYDFVGEDEEGRITIDLAGKTRAQMAALAEVMMETKTRREDDGTTETTTRVRVKLWDKKGALIDLLKHFNGVVSTGAVMDNNDCEFITLDADAPMGDAPFAIAADKI